jgi:hypothetical protein
MSAPGGVLTTVMHSENLQDHILFKKLLEARASACLSETERESLNRITEFENKHRESGALFSPRAIGDSYTIPWRYLDWLDWREGAVIERFGRYPSRNDVLERESTPEEKEFVKNGVGWWSYIMRHGRRCEGQVYNAHGLRLYSSA